MARNRFVHSIASSLSRHSSSAQPPISSLASVKGPSVTVNSPLWYATLVASCTGPTPPVASSTPALVASSTNLPISAISSGVGGGIGADGSPSVYPRNRIVSFLSVRRRPPWWRPERAGARSLPSPALSCPCVERGHARSTPAGTFRREIPGRLDRPRQGLARQEPSR